MPSEGIIDDKSEVCIPFLLERLELHKARHVDNPNPPPFFVGLNGIQGAGKTVLVSILQDTLSSAPHNLPTVTFSLDDIYLTHADQAKLAASNPSNPLLQHRGQPSTHDLGLGASVFESLRRNLPTKIPSYDKSAFNGQGDRVPEDKWRIVNDTEHGQQHVKVVIFEGWCVGFRALPDAEIRSKWEKAVQRRQNDSENYRGRLGHVKLEDVLTINEALKGYDVFTDQFDAFFHIDAMDLQFVYNWRQEQERTLRAATGKGMTVEQVNNFVNGYYPSYELFTYALRDGAFKRVDTSGEDDPEKADKEQNWRHVRMIVDEKRTAFDVRVVRGAEDDL